MEPFLPTLSEPARRWLRLAVLLLVIALLGWVVYDLRAVFTPLFIAAALAYVLNPLVTWCEHKFGVQRLTTVIVATALLGALVIGGGFYLGSRTIVQIAEFERRVPGYVRTLEHWSELARSGIGDTNPALRTDEDTQPADRAMSASLPAAHDEWWKWVAPLVKEHGVQVAGSTLSYVRSAVANVANLASLLVLIPVFAFYFLWRFNDFVRVLRGYLPATYRDHIIHVVRVIDAAVADFFRGRLIVCLVVATLAGIGWTLVGLPYSLVLGVLLGIFNLVPFLSLLALPPVLLFAYLGAVEHGAPWMWPVVLTMGVYMGVQALEAFVLSPAILGHSAGLHPLAIVVALLIGAELAGLLGLLLAIPVASTLRTLTAEMLLPELRRLAGRADAGPTGE